MNLINVDVVGAQPAKRILDLAHDSRAAGIADYFPVLPFESDLGGDEHARTQAVFGEGLADDLLGATEAVGRSRVDDVDAMLDRGADGGDGFRLVGSAPHPAADRPGTERDARYFERGTGNSGPFDLHLGNISLLDDRVTPIRRALRLRAGCPDFASHKLPRRVSLVRACRPCAVFARKRRIARLQTAANARGSLAPWSSASPPTASTRSAPTSPASRTWRRRHSTASRSRRSTFSPTSISTSPSRRSSRRRMQFAPSCQPASSRRSWCSTMPRAFRCCSSASPPTASVSSS